MGTKLTDWPANVQEQIRAAQLRAKPTPETVCSHDYASSTGAVPPVARRGKASASLSDSTIASEPLAFTGVAGFRLTINCQIIGGKNNYIVTRQGKHVPRATWAKWRDKRVAEVRAQLPSGWQPIAAQTTVSLDYVAGDKRRRDMPAIIDSIWHVLERSGVVTDDTLLWVAHSTRSYDKANPRAVITFDP